MFTLLMPNRSHIVNDEDAERIINALRTGQAVETVEIELNGPGSGFWEVTINVAQVIALVRSPESKIPTERPTAASLRLVPS